MSENELSEFKYNIMHHFLEGGGWDILLLRKSIADSNKPKSEKDIETELTLAFFILEELPCLDLIETERGILLRKNNNKHFSTKDLAFFYKKEFEGLTEEYYRVLDLINELHEAV